MILCDGVSQFVVRANKYAGICGYLLLAVLMPPCEVACFFVARVITAPRLDADKLRQRVARIQKSSLTFQRIAVENGDGQTREVRMLRTATHALLTMAEARLDRAMKPMDAAKAAGLPIDQERYDKLNREWEEACAARLDIDLDDDD